MRALRAIPHRLLPDTCVVRERLEDGRYGVGRAIRHVRFERAQATSTDEHRWADAGCGTLFIDAVSSQGAFEVRAGSRVEIGGQSYLVASVKRFEGARGRVHHWELDLR